MAKATITALGFSKDLGSDARRLLRDSIKADVERLKLFKAALDSQQVQESIEDEKVFADILRYAVEKGIVPQTRLAEEIKYASSQVGRWAAGKAVPPVLVREAVFQKLKEMVAAELERACSNGLVGSYAEG